MNQCLCFLLFFGFVSLADASNIPQVWQESRSGVFVPPQAQDLQQAQHLFMQVLHGASVDESAWFDLGMQGVQLQYKKERFWVIREIDAQQHGRGFFIIRQKNTNSPFMLQAPHAFKDLYTGRIALKLFLAGTAKASVWNTVPRSYQANKQQVDADMAHLNGTFFLAFSKAFARSFPNGKTLQLHGFSKQKRTSVQGRKADVIVSSGHRYANHSVQSMAHCFKQHISQQSFLYPTEVTELGGTRNVIAQMLQHYPKHHFIHLEMSFEIRRSLRKNKGQRAKVLSCL